MFSCPGFNIRGIPDRTGGEACKRFGKVRTANVAARGALANAEEFCHFSEPCEARTVHVRAAYDVPPTSNLPIPLYCPQSGQFGK